MNELKVGDVVYLNSENRIKMTVSYIGDGMIECIYYNPSVNKFEATMTVPINVVSKDLSLGV